MIYVCLCYLISVLSVFILCLSVSDLYENSVKLGRC